MYHRHKKIILNDFSINNYLMNIKELNDDSSKKKLNIKYRDIYRDQL